jgi:hypothetical protein
LARALAVFVGYAPVPLPFESSKPGFGDVTVVDPTNLTVDVPPPLFQTMTNVYLVGGPVVVPISDEQLLPCLVKVAVAVTEVAAVTELAGSVVQPDTPTPLNVICVVFDVAVPGTNLGFHVTVAVRLVQLMVAAGGFLADATPPVSVTALTRIRGATAAKAHLANVLFTCPPYG